jgi:hypothetical protein
MARSSAKRMHRSIAARALELDGEEELLGLADADLEREEVGDGEVGAVEHVEHGLELGVGHGEQGAHREVAQRVRQRLGVLGEPAQQVLDFRVVQVRRARLRLCLRRRGRGAYGRRARAHGLRPVRLRLRDEVQVAVLPAQVLQALGVPEHEPLRLRSAASAAPFQHHCALAMAGESM